MINKPPSPQLQTYLEQILAKNGVNPQSLNGQNLTKSLYKRLDVFLTERIVDALPEDKLNDFSSLIRDKSSQRNIDGFIKQYIPDIEIVMQKAFSDFEDFYTGRKSIV